MRDHAFSVFFSGYNLLSRQENNYVHTVQNYYLKFYPPVGKHVIHCNCPGNLKSLDFFSSHYFRKLDKISLNFKDAFVLFPGV